MSRRRHTEPDPPDASDSPDVSESPNPQEAGEVGGDRQELSPEAAPGERPKENVLRPRNFVEFVGQQKLKDNLKALEVKITEKDKKTIDKLSPPCA